MIRVTCKGAASLPLDKLQAFQGELKRLNPKNAEKLEKSIREYGFTAPFFVWDGNLLDGHQRMKVLQKRFRKEEYPEAGFPVVYIYADNEKEAKKKLLQITSQYGEFDAQGLADFTDGLDFDFDSIRLTDGEFDFKPPEEGTKDDDEAPEVDEEEEPQSKLGEIYELGPHRLMCGDSTDPEQVARLMGGEKADLWLTDPPYNVDYKEKNDRLNEIRKGRSHKAIESDKLEDKDFLAFLIKAFGSVYRLIGKGKSFYIFHPEVERINFQKALEKNSFQWRQTLIWAKNNHVLGRWDYQPKHEPCLYGWKDGGSHNFYPGRCETTVIDNKIKPNPAKMKREELVELCKELLKSKVPETILEFDKPAKSIEHPTMKPVALFKYLIKNSTKPGEIVLDTFGGSGTTIISAESAGRKARVMELGPHYCDVIRKRWYTWAIANDRDPGKDGIEVINETQQAN